MTSKISLFVATLLSLFTLEQNVFACASCGCAVESDWNSQDFSLTSGLKLDFKYDYIDQSSLWSGTHSISSTSASQVINNGDPQEIEKFTTSRIYTGSIDYSTYEWGVNVQIPYIVRDHSTLGTNSDGITAGTAGGQYDSKTSSIGDMKIVGRYMGLLHTNNFGILFGLKLPTGNYQKTGTSTDANNQGDIAIDRGLQPGSGTTDLIVGALYHIMLTHSIDSFYQFTYQSAFNSKDQYKPGNSLNLNSGINYYFSEYFIPKIQVNYRDIQKDSGAQADTISTGGKLVYISPGFNINVNTNLSLYVYVQLPVYRDLNGVQLVPKAIETVGLQYRF